VKGVRTVEVVVEAVVDGGADAELGFGVELEDGGGEEVSSGVPVDLEGLGILVGQDLEGGVGIEGAGEVPEDAVDAGDDGGFGEARGDGLGDVEGPGAGGDGFLAAVGQGDGETAHNVGKKGGTARGR